MHRRIHVGTGVVDNAIDSAFEVNTVLPAYFFSE